MTPIYCSNCGKEIDENAKFCTNCGAQHSANSGHEKSEKKEKNKKIIISLIVVLIAFIFGRFIIAPSMTTEPTTTASSAQSTYAPTTNSTVQEQISEFDKIFLDRYIVQMPSIFRGLDSNSFAKADEEGFIEKIEFGYKDDIVKEMINTVYYDISAYTEEQIKAFESELKETYAYVEELSFCTSDYEASNNYYTVMFTFKELDKAENIQKLANFGILSGTNADYISMAQTESGLISNGYAKK